MAEEKEKKVDAIRIPETDLKRVVVIGGGFAGLNFVKKLKNKNVQVIVIDRNNFHQFQPLLYQVATSGIVPDSIAFPLRKQFKNYNNVFFRMGEVLRVDSKNKTLITDIGNLKYDYLVLATGSDTNFFGMEDVQENSVGMKSLQEALDIRSMLLQRFEEAVVTSDDNLRDALTNFVVVGGGPAGVETVGAIAEFRRYIVPKDYPDLNASVMSIHLIESGNELLNGMSASSSEKALRYLEAMGAKVHLGNRVISYDGTNIKTNTGLSFRTRSVIWTAGVKGSTPEGISEESYAEARRLLVNEYSELIGHDNVYAIGDIALMRTERYPKGHPMVAPSAIQQGKLLAENLINEMNGKPKKKFVYRDKGSLATIGKRKAVADIWGMKFGGRLAWWVWSFVHLISISGFKNKVIVGLNWAWSYYSYDKGSRIIVRLYRSKKEKK